MISDPIPANQFPRLIVLLEHRVSASEINAGNILLPRLTFSPVKVIPEVEDIIGRDDFLSREQIDRVRYCPLLVGIGRSLRSHPLDIAQAGLEHIRRRIEPSRLCLDEEVHHIGG